MLYEGQKLKDASFERQGQKIKRRVPTKNLPENKILSVLVRSCPVYITKDRNSENFSTGSPGIRGHRQRRPRPRPRRVAKGARRAEDRHGAQADGGLPGRPLVGVHRRGARVGGPVVRPPGGPGRRRRRERRWRGEELVRPAARPGDTIS